jgi:hypothetical protein
MPIHAKTNLYPGVNAHLNSFLQLPGNGWESFHACHIEEIARALDALLPSNFYVLTEKSLQISFTGGSAEPSRTVRPDVSIFQITPSPVSLAAYSGSEPTAVLPLAETMIDEDETLTAVVVYELAQSGDLPGKPVTRIEVLSPSNKPPLGDYVHYRRRRQHTLSSGVAMVEIDYLHHLPPILWRIPSYADAAPGAYPYVIAVSTPYPSSSQGQFKWYGAEVDMPLASVPIPLGTSAETTLAFNTVYNQTFEARRAFSLMVDYMVDPLAFERYRADDQAKIRALLDGIRAT